MNNDNIAKRIKSVRTRLAAKVVDCLIVTKPANVTYVTGFGGDDSWALITPRSVYLLTDSRYTEQAHKECIGCRVVERKDTMIRTIVTLARRYKSTRVAGIESSTPAAIVAKVRRALPCRVKCVTDIIEEVRQVKSASEVALIRRAALIAAEALAKAVSELSPGMTEAELAGRVELEIRRAGGASSFEPVVAFGANASQPHHQPGSKKLKKNDTVLIDLGARYKGYCSDITRCFVVGRCARAFARAYRAVYEAQKAAIAAVRAQVPASRVETAARSVIARYGLPVYGHGTGHGIGLEVHEHPIVSSSVKEKLKAGQAITIEPAVYIPGKFGVRIEDDFLVTEKGCRLLSGAAPKGPSPAYT